MWQRLSCDGLPGGPFLLDSNAAAFTPPMNANATPALVPAVDAPTFNAPHLHARFDAANSATLPSPTLLHSPPHACGVRGPACEVGSCPVGPQAEAAATQRAPLRIIRWAERAAVTISDRAVSLEAAWVESFKEAAAVPLMAGVQQRLEHCCSVTAAEFLRGREGIDVAGQQQFATPRLPSSLFHWRSAEKHALQQVNGLLGVTAPCVPRSRSCRAIEEAEEERVAEGVTPRHTGGSMHSAVQIGGRVAQACNGKVQAGSRAEWRGHRRFSSLVTRVLWRGSGSSSIAAEERQLREQ